MANLLQRTVDNARQTIGSQLGNIRDTILPRSIDGLELSSLFGFLGGDVKVFPLSLRDSGATGDRPMISFTIEFDKGSAPTTIFFPCPGGIAFNDNGTYGTINLGVLGAGAEKVVKAIQSGSNAGGGGAGAMEIAKTVGGQITDLTKQIMTNTSAQAELVREGINSASAFGQGGLGNFVTESVSNPRENTTFTSNTLRSFSFNFKLIASSAEEAREVKLINETFQRAIYAKKIPGSINSLQFPPTTEVKFLFKGAENKFIPKIHKTYLTGLSSTFNSSSNAYRTNGEPFEVDFSLTFQETRALTREDIEELQKDSPDRSKGERGQFRKIGEATRKTTQGVIDSATNTVESITGAVDNLGTIIEDGVDLKSLFD